MIRNGTAVITGAGSGIGRGIAIALSRRGCHLALADIDGDGLEETAHILGETGLRISRHQLDVADAEAVAALPGQIMAEHGRIDILVNNAGVAIGGTFEQLDEEDFDWLFEVNFKGLVRMTRAFLPLLRESDSAHLVNLSSLFGLIAPPGQTAYCASKFAVRGFSESLRHELEAQKSPIVVTLVHPGGIATNIARSARPPRGADPAEIRRNTEKFSAFLKMPPDRAGEIIVRAMEKKQPRVLVGSDARGAAMLQRLFPVTYWKHLQRRMS